MSPNTALLLNDNGSTTPCHHHRHPAASSLNEVEAHPDFQQQQHQQQHHIHHEPTSCSLSLTCVRSTVADTTTTSTTALCKSSSILKHKSQKESLDGSYYLRSKRYSVSSSCSKSTLSTITNVESSPTTTTSDRSVSVTFTNIKTYYFMIAIGDNPSVSKGPPIQLDWKAIEIETTPMKEDNNDDKDVATTKYPRKVFNFPSSQRIAKLRENGYSRQEIQSVTKYATIARNKRRQTIINLHRAPYEEQFEIIYDKVTCHKVEVIEYYPTKAMAKQEQLQHQHPPNDENNDPWRKDICPRCSCNLAMASHHHISSEGREDGSRGDGASSSNGIGKTSFKMFHHPNECPMKKMSGRKR